MIDEEVADTVREVTAQAVADAVRQLCIEANTVLPCDLRQAICAAREREVSPVGKAILAELPEKEARRLWERSEHRVYTPNTIVSWEELAEDDASTTWDVTLLSPTVFTSRGRHVPGVTPEQLATSLHARWHAWSPQNEPPRLHRDDLDVLTMQDRTEPVRVNLGMPSADRRGRLTRRSTGSDRSCMIPNSSSRSA